MSEPRTTVTVYPDGPLIVRGPAEFVDEDGRPVPRRRATVAVCRCGGSTVPPWCDGTHKALARGRRRARARATDEGAPEG